MLIISQKVIKSQKRESSAGKGIPVVEIFKYMICLIFSDRSMYMQLVTGKFVENICTNIIYRFLNNSKTNW